MARYSERYDDFLARFAPHDDGHAAERVVDAAFADAISRGVVPPAPPVDPLRERGERVMTESGQASELSA